MSSISPPYLPLSGSLASDLDAALMQSGTAVLGAQAVSQLSTATSTDLASLEETWNDLPPDHFLKDGGSYRKRRHASYVLRQQEMLRAPHRAHWQSLDYNALHGGMQRWFEPVDSRLDGHPAWLALHRWLAALADARFGAQPWYVESHQFRIDTAGGIGRPTPEGAHRDGVDLVAVFLVSRVGIKGGETRVFDASAPTGQRFTLSEPWSLLLLDDARVIHETTPIQPSNSDQPGHRDTLVVTLRRGGFQAG